MRAEGRDPSDGGGESSRPSGEQRNRERAGVGQKVRVQPDGFELGDREVEELDHRLLKKSLVDQRELSRAKRI